MSSTATGDGERCEGVSRDARETEKAITRPAMQKPIKINTWKQSCEGVLEPHLERGEESERGGKRIGEMRSAEWRGDGAVDTVIASLAFIGNTQASSPK